MVVITGSCDATVLAEGCASMVTFPSGTTLVAFLGAHSRIYSNSVKTDTLEFLHCRVDGIEKMLEDPALARENTEILQAMRVDLLLEIAVRIENAAILGRGLRLVWNRLKSKRVS